MDNRTSLRRLEIFCLVVDAGGVTRAAEQLRVAQPAVSAQLRALEHSLDSVLLTRVGNVLALTEAGERVYSWAKDVVAGYTQMQRDIEQLAAGEAGSLIVHASMAIGTYLLPPVFTRLRAERQGADITVHIGEPSAVIRATELGEADFVVTTVPDEPAPETLVANQLWDEPIVLVVGPTGPHIGDSVSLTEVASLPLVAAPKEVVFDRILRAQLKRAGAPELDIVLRLGHAEAIKKAALDNDWACLMPRYVVADDVADGRLRAIPIRDATLTEGIGLYHRPGKYFSPLQQAAINALQARGRKRRESA